ncbi:MAG: sodium:proton exchanger [Rhodopseudomonas palustris]|nr:MAG: sodium:proton exchanger [Rhodopseudomonas palustris]
MMLLLVLTAIAFVATAVVGRVLAASAPEGRLYCQTAGAASMVVGPFITLVAAFVLGKAGIGGEVLDATATLSAAALPAFGTLFVGPIAFWFFRRQRRTVAAA